MKLKVSGEIKRKKGTETVSCTSINSGVFICGFLHVNRR